MRKYFVIIASLLAAAVVLDTKERMLPEEVPILNRLGKEKSPYLLQHKDNPVSWFAWGEEAFEAARKEDKPIFLSIGYSTCYWCHMMEQDSFEKPEVAEALNRNFISIKVDREEHPDVDQIYMDAVVGMTGRGGWPMSVFLTPDLKPFFGGTFFWRDQFLGLLAEIQTMWKEDREKVLHSAGQITKFLQEKSDVAEGQGVGEELLRQAFQEFRKNFDENHGGFGGAPKFPPSMAISLLLRIYRRTGNSQALEMATKTLTAMALGGIYDHIGGGFHRYSTDDRWLVPHFEKMLYDNALLSWAYLEAYQLTKKPLYAKVAKGTLDYILREMGEPQGGFFSAQDAGEVGKEGEFYLWKEGDLKKILSEDEFKGVKYLFQVSSFGNFSTEGPHKSEGQNILHLPSEASWTESLLPPIQNARKKLFEERLKRAHPYKDDKILTSWNGLMIAAMARGHQVLGDLRYLSAAQASAKFIRERLFKDGKLLRRYRDGEAKFGGTLEDYAFLIHGLLSLYAIDFDLQWITWAKGLQAKQDEIFWDEKDGGYYFSEASDPTLIVRKKDFHDGAIPSGNSIAALNLLRLHDITLNEAYRAKATRLLSVASLIASRIHSGFAGTLIALDYFLDRAKEVAVIGGRQEKAVAEILSYLYQNFLPNMVVAFADSVSSENLGDIAILKGKPTLHGKATIYVCENNSCKLPTNDLETAKKLLTDFKKYEL